MNTFRRLPLAISAHEAAGHSPSLARLTELVQDSNKRLAAIQSLLPDALRAAVKAGPIEGESWCLLVTGNAPAAKIRQLVPLILTRLNSKGWKVTSIRLKILIVKR